MKKLTAILVALMLIVGATLTFVACDVANDKPATVMNMSLNPEVEFVLDGHGKVISVNALNEDGNLIITAAVFEGKTAEEAAKLFVQVSHELGFLVSGNAKIENNDIEIEISGDATTAKELYDGVKAKITEYFTAENIIAQIEAVETLTRAHLEELVAKSQPYVEKAKLEALSHMELIEQLYLSRKETHDMYSQELKNAYYQAKAAAMDTAKVQALKDKMGEKFNAVFEKLLADYTTALENIEAKRFEYLVSAESDYQIKLAEYRQRKIEFLQYRQELSESQELSDGQIAYLDTLQGSLELAEYALEKAGELANTSLDLAKTAVTTSYNLLVGAMESAQVLIADHLDAIMQAQEEQVPVFAEEFETSYANAVAQAKADWEAMKTQLQSDTSTEK